MAGAHGSDGNPPDDLPDLPEEWGVIVIPDDLSELSDEVEAIRAELKQTERSDRWHRLFDRPGLRQLRQLGMALLRAPVLIISMALLVTVASLFASAWPGPPRQPVVQRTNDERISSLPALDLVADDGTMVSLRAKLPAIVLVTDGCDCAGLIAATAAAAKSQPRIAIVVIAAALSNAATDKPSAASSNPGAAAGGNTSTGPSAASGKQTAASTPATRSTPATQTTPVTQTAPQAPAAQPVQTLHNPASNNVREQLKLDQPDGTAAALVVGADGRVVHEARRTKSVADIQPFLAQL